MSYIIVLKAKLHRAVVTHSELEYEGSCAIDASLLEQAGIHPYEQIHAYNLDNAARFITYAIRAEPRSGIISANGAAAHLAKPGDRLIICAYKQIQEAQIAAHQPLMIGLDEQNGIISRKHTIPEQAA